MITEEFKFDESIDFYNQNSEFNEFLDINGEIEVGNYSYLPSKILFHTDNRAYLLELQEWREGVRVSKVESAEGILDIGDNKHRINDLIRRLKSRRVIPFVGAGMSVPSGLPSWEKFLKNCALSCGVDEQKVNELLNNGHYEKCADEIINVMKEDWFLQKFRYQFTCEKNELDGPVKLMPDIFSTGVLTTNFDRLLEMAYDGHLNSFRDTFLEIRKDSIDFISRGESNLFKMHGHFQVGDKRVLTESEYNLVYGENEIDLSLVLPRFMKSISQSYCLMFLGCSLKNDRVMKLLKKIKSEIKDEGGKSPEHFALVSEPETKEERLEREKFLIEHMIYPIWYPSQRHEYIDYIFNYILEKVST